MTHDTDPSIAVIGPEGAALLAALHDRCFDRPWQAADFAILLALPTVTALVARQAGAAPEPVGFVMFQLLAGKAEILTIAVLPAKQGAGIGGLILAKAHDDLSAQGARDVYLQVEETNQRARRLYRAAGFGVVNRRGGYYQSLAGGAVDALCLRLRLGGRDGCPRADRD